ncbi:unnamed protein product [Rodentolepis nana]|uniref:Ovule protein n=1 Tax=Rodentolepis nana TaxID=102285 RepID=A0A0R3THY8_RODNA|nr:unnamed protein product [Rodentolepis nana]
MRHSVELYDGLSLQRFSSKDCLQLSAALIISSNELIRRHESAQLRRLVGGPSFFTSSPSSSIQLEAYQSISCSILPCERNKGSAKLQFCQSFSVDSHRVKFACLITCTSLSS